MKLINSSIEDLARVLDDSEIYDSTIRGTAIIAGDSIVIQSDIKAGYFEDKTIYENDLWSAPGSYIFELNGSRYILCVNAGDYRKTIGNKVIGDTDLTYNSFVAGNGELTNTLVEYYRGPSEAKLTNCYIRTHNRIEDTEARNVCFTDKYTGQFKLFDFDAKMPKLGELLTMDDVMSLNPKAIETDKDAILIILMMEATGNLLYAQDLIRLLIYEQEYAGELEWLLQSTNENFEARLPHYEEIFKYKLTREVKRGEKREVAETPADSLTNVHPESVSSEEKVQEKLQPEIIEESRAELKEANESVLGPEEETGRAVEDVIEQTSNEKTERTEENNEEAASNKDATQVGDFKNSIVVNCNVTPGVKVVDSYLVGVDITEDMDYEYICKEFKSPKKEWPYPTREYDNLPPNMYWMCQLEPEKYLAMAILFENISWAPKNAAGHIVGLMQENRLTDVTNLYYEVVNDGLFIEEDWELAHKMAKHRLGV